MRTTLELPDSLFERAKRLARKRKIPFRALMAEALRALVDESSAPVAYVLPDCSFQGDGLVEGLAETDWDRIRDLSYEGRGA